MKCIVMRISQSNYGKGVWKRHLFERVILATRVKGHRVPPQSRCSRVCPPWAHRSYATGCVLFHGCFMYEQKSTRRSAIMAIKSIMFFHWRHSMCVQKGVADWALCFPDWRNRKGKNKITVKRSSFLFSPSYCLTEKGYIKLLLEHPL